MNDNELVKMAHNAKENAMPNWTKFRVGAAILTKSGKVFAGCNVESPSDIEGICAERNAIFKAISEEGKFEIDTIAVASDIDDFIYPCGRCRQQILEFGRNAKILVSTNKGEFKAHTISELLPYAYSGDEIDINQKTKSEES